MGDSVHGGRLRWLAAVASTAAILAAAACSNSSPSGAGAAAGGTTPASPSAPGSASPGAASSLEQQYERVVAAVLPSVVQISTSEGSGSGVVFEATAAVPWSTWPGR
jgi:putative serine protease PepD